MSKEKDPWKDMLSKEEYRAKFPQKAMKDEIDEAIEFNRQDRNPMEHQAKCDNCNELHHVSELVRQRDDDNNILVCEECKEEKK